MSLKLPKKGLKIAHLNICSLRNKVHEITSLLKNENLHILAISETHLDSTIGVNEIAVSGYNVFRNDRNSYGGGVAIYVQNHMPVKTRGDLLTSDIEALWIQIHLPHTKPFLLGCCYRQPSAHVQYLEEICLMLQKDSDCEREIYFLGDLNIDWLSATCSRKLSVIAKVCNLSQMLNVPI